MEDNTQHMRDELAQLDEDIEKLKKDEEEVADPSHMHEKGPHYYESGSADPGSDDQTITPPG